jgi:hypothetical protein
MLDAALNWVKTNCDHVYVCTSQPTTYAQASSSYKLGGASYASVGSPANGSSSGRKVTVAAASSIAITSSGKMQHIALTGSISSTQTLLYVTTIPASSQASVAASDKVNMAAWNITIGDAAAPA